MYQNDSATGLITSLNRCKLNICIIGIAFDVE